MAGTKALNVRMNFQVDTTQARQQIQQLGAQLNSITKASNVGINSQLGITSQILEATKAAGQLKIALTEAINPLTGNLNLSAFNDQLIASKMSLADYRTQLSALGTTGNQTFNSLARSIMTAETPLLRTGRAAQQMWTVLGNTVRWQATSSMIHGIMSTASQAMNYVKSLDSSLNSIRIVTGQNQAQMERFAQTANKAAKDLNTTTNAYAKASLIYYQQGLSNAEVEKRVATTVKLANVSGQTAAKVSDQLTAIWNNFYDGSKSLEYYADVMTALGASTASSTDEIAKGLEKFSSIAKTTGLSYEYATSALSTVVAATRQSADSVGTSFKTLFSRLQGLSLGETLDDGTTLNKYSKALDIIGVNIKNANGSLKDMDRILDEIGDKWTTLSKAEQVALAQTVGGARNYTGLVSLMDNWDSFQTNLKTAQQAQGTLQNQADIYAQSWEAASNHVRVASETIYKNLLDDKFFKGMTNMFGYILDGIGEVTNQMGGFKGVMSGLANFAFTTFAPQISKGFANIGSSIYGLTPRGQERVLNLRTEAMNAISDQNNFSQYAPVNALQQQYGKAFNARQIAYDNLVLKGRISDYDKSAYQMLFQAADLQNEQAIAATEKSYQATDAAALAELRGKQRFNYQLNQNPNLTARMSGQAFFDKYSNIFQSDKDKKAFINYAGLQTSVEAGNVRAAHLLGGKNATLFANFTPEMVQEYRLAQGQRNSMQTQFSKDITRYGDALFKESIASGISTRLGSAALTGDAVSKEDAARTAGFITRTIEGAKGYGLVLGDQYKALIDVNDKINEQTKLYNEGSISQEKYNQEIANIINNDAGLTKWLSSAMSDASGSGAIYESLVKQVQDANQGMSAADARSQVNEILQAKDMDVAQKLEAIDKIGGAGTANAAIQKMLEQQTKASTTINMSSALATNMGALASLGQVVNSVSTAFKTFSDENATAGQQIASLTSLAMSGSMAIKPFGNFIKTAGEQVTVFGKSLGITNGALGGIMLGLAATGMAVKTYINEQKKVSIAGQIETLNTSIATSQQLTADATAAYETLLSGETTHNNLISKINTLKKGTSDFTAALLEANETANNLIETGSLIYGEDYFYDQNGLINFQPDALKRAEENALELRKERLAGQNQLQIARNTLQYYHSYISDLSSIGGYQTYNLPYIQQALTTVTKDKNSFKNVGVGDLLTAILKEAGDKGVGQFNANNIDILQAGLNNVLPIAGKFDLSNKDFQNNLMNMTMTSSVEEAYSKLADAANYLKSQGINGGWLTNQQFEDLTPENQFFIASLFNPDAMKQVQLNGQNSIDSVLSNMELSDSTRDLVNFAISSNPDFAKNMLSLYSTATLAGTQSLGEGVLYGESPRDWYQQLYGKMADANYTDEQVDALVQQKLIQDILLNGTDKYTNLKQLENFTTINDTLQKVQDLNLPNLENLNYQQITEQFDALLDTIHEFGQSRILDTETNKAIQEYRNYAKQIYDNQLNDLATAMLRGIGDGLLNGITETEEGSKFEELVTGLAGQITDNGKEIMSSLTYGALKQATNAMINANEVGEATAETMYSLLLRGRTQNGGFDADTLTAIQNYNFDNTIASIYSNNNLKRYAANQAQRDKYIELFSSQIEAIGKEKGWFQMLYNSSGFSDVLDKINSQFQLTGQITAQYITDLAGKSEELSQFLKVSSDSAGLLNVNAGGLAAIFEEINRGTSGLTSTNISSDFIKAVSHGASQQSMNTAAFETVDNLDISRASSDLMDYFQDAGKAWYGIKQSGQGFYSDRMQDLIRLYGNDETRKVYQEALSHKNWSFDQMWNYMVKNDTSGFTSSMETYAGVKKGKAKGGGGPADVWSQAYDLLGIEGLTPEEQAALFEELGLEVTKDGSVYLNEYGNETSEEILNNLIERAKARGMDENAARDFFTVAMGFVTNSGQTGDELARRGAKKGEQDLLAAQNPVNEEMLKAYFNQYGTILGYGTGEDGYNQFKDDFRKKGGQIGVSLSKEEWRGVATTEDLVKKAQEQGIMQNDTGGPVAITNFRQLADVYGAVTTGGQLDYDKLVTMIGSMGGTEEDLIRLLENNADLVDSLVARDNAGNDIKRKEGESLRDYVNRIHESQGDVEFKYSGLSSEAANMAYMYEHMVMSQNEDGTWSWHYETQEDKDRKAAEEQHKADVAKRQQLKEQFGYSDYDIDEAIASGDTLDTLITNEKQKEEDRKKEEAEQAELERRADVLNLTTDQVQEYDQLRADLGESSINIDTYKAYQAYKEANPDYEGSWMDWHDAGMPEAETTNNTTNAEATESGEETQTTTEPKVTETGGQTPEEAKAEQEAQAAALEEERQFQESGLTREQWNDYKTSGLSFEKWQALQQDDAAFTLLDTAADLLANPEGTSTADSEKLAVQKAAYQRFEKEIGEQTKSPATGDISRTLTPEDLANPDILRELNLNALQQIMNTPLYDQYMAQAFNAETGMGLEGALSPYEFLQFTQQQREAEADRLQKEADAKARDAAEREGSVSGEQQSYLDKQAEDAQEAADFYKYQNVMTPEQRMAEINKAIDIYDNGQGADKLTPFQKFLMNSIGEIVDYQGIMADATETDEEGKAKTKNAQLNEEGQLVDEEGNPIEMPEGSQPTGGGTGGRESGDAGTNGRTRNNPGNGPGNSGLGPGAAPGSHVDTWEKGGHKGGIFRGSDGLDYNFTYNRNGDPVVDRDENGTPVQADTENNKFANLLASGQNNAQLLAYASGKEGHIAITGELGPELRVKSDGSMDILGKKGREYAWVEPDDRIYTASQSAGILKSNKIPGLEGLAKGINNFIPGYDFGRGAAAEWSSSGSSSSGGGGGGGGGGEKSRGGGGGAAVEKDPRYDPQTLKIRDVLERYYTILQQIDNITKAVERFSKVADRAWGRERIRAIEHQNELQQKQYEAQKKYISEIEEYLDTDQSTMTTMIKEFVDGWNKAVDENTDPNNTMEKISWAGAQFDQDGVLTNYRDFVEKLVEQYNQNAASANQEVQYKFQEQLKDIQMYTDTLNLYEEQINALEDIKNAILDTAVKVVTYEVEYKLELSGDTDRILNFQADKYKDDVYQAAKYLELLDQRADLTRKNLETVTEGIMKTLGNYAGENMRVGALHTLDELGVYGTNKFEIPEELLEELDEEDEEDAEKLKELQAERSRNITKQIGAWIDEAYATHKDDVEKIEKMLSFSSEEGAGDFTYDENWRDTYDSWEDYYNEVINKTDNDTERFIDNYEEIVGKLNGLVDFQKVRAQIGDWLEELRMKDAEAAAEIDKIVRYTEDGQIANYSDVLEKLNEANVKLNDEFIELLYTDQDAFFEAMSDFQNNPGWVDFTTEHKDQLTNWMDAIYQYLESLQDTYKQTIEQLGDSVKATSKQMDSAIDEFDYYENIYKEFKNIVDLTNREMTDITKGYFDALNSKSMDNAINKIKGTVTNYHLLQGELKEITRQYEEMQARADAATGEEQIFLQQSADKLKEQMDIANSQFEDAHKNYLSAWEDALNKMSEIYKNTLEEASKEFEKSFSPLFNTLALLQAQFDREKALGDLYVDNYQRIHDLSKLNRDIAASITDTDNLKGKERLRDLQAEINQLQEDGTELSEYDLDILDKKYKLELARQALEDAKDAKSMVRLARDNNGNWSYVYTANQDDVDKAEQDYEDAIREMEQANEDYIDNIQDQILQVQQEAQQAIIALQPEDFATYDDYLAAVQAIQSSMYDTLNFLRSQMNNAFGNNEWLDPYIVNRYGLNDHDLTTNFGDTTLAKLLDSDDLDRSIDHARNNFENNLMSPALEAYLTYSQKQQQVYEAAEHNMATIGEDFGKEMEYVAEMSDNEVQIVEKLSDRVQTAFEDMANVVDEKTAKHIAEMDKLVNLYEKLVEAITRVKELSGENLPIEGGQFIGKIDSWAEIQRLNKELTEHGDFRVLEDLTELNPEDLQDRKEAMQKATEKIGEWMETLLTDAVDEETRTAIQDMVEKDENGLITNYKQVISKLAQIEKTDENKDILKEIKKWRATEQKAMYTSPRQVYKENEGLYTNFVADDQFTKDYISWITDQLLYKQMKTASADGVRDTERAEIETYFNAHGGVWVQKGDIEEFFDNWTELQAWLNANAYVESSGGGGDTPWTTGGFSQHWLDQNWSGGYLDTGGYTGRWQFADTGMYTGEWPDGSTRRNGRLAWLHQKELILNAHDTENFLDAMQIVRQLDNLTNWMANGLGDLIMPNVSAEASELEQNVHIEAEFPNVTNHSEIEQAFNNLVNMASQYANRK